MVLLSRVWCRDLRDLIEGLWGALFKVGIFMFQMFLVLWCGCGGPEIIGLLCIWGVVMFCGLEIIELSCDWCAVYGLASSEDGS